jgi:hypothetical protein
MHRPLGTRSRRAALTIGSCATAVLAFVYALRGADAPPPSPAAMFQQYCYACHGNNVATAGISLEKLTAAQSVAENYQAWERVLAVLDQKRMPPKGMPQPGDEQRANASAWIHAQLDAYVRTHAGDPGRVTVRRLTSGEYSYAIHDLTGLDLDLGIDSSNDSVGGEGFTNFGDVQFMQDANLQRYLEAAKSVADHAVVGAGPIQFYVDPGKTGFEMSAIHRIKAIYSTYGFRTVSGEGGFSFGLEKYGKALFAAWEYQHRAALGKPNATFATLSADEGVTARFVEHLYRTMNRSDLQYPSAEMASRFHKLPAPTADIAGSTAAARAKCEELQKYLTGWPSWLFARGDAAFGGAGDESPLIITEKSLKVEAAHHFVYNRFNRPAGRGAATPSAPPPTTLKFYLFASPVNPQAKGKPVMIWRSATVSFRAGFGRGAAATVSANGADDPNAPPAAGAGAGANPPAGGRGGAPAGPRVPLREAVTEESAKALKFGTSPDGTALGPDDFASDLASTAIEVKLPPGMTTVNFQADAQVGADRDQVFRVIITDREDGSSRGIPLRAIIGNPQSAGYQAFKAGVLQLADILPPNSNSEPTPADKDPPPEPFDPTYNVPEHDAFDNDVKYVRDDRFIYNHVLEDAVRRRVDEAWDDLYTSFEYHDHWWKLLDAHYKLDRGSKHIGELTKADFEAMPAEARGYAMILRKTYDEARAAEKAAEPRHFDDCVEFASRAWRRPLTAKEKLALRTFYQNVLVADPDHTRAVKAVIARILVAPEFLYKLEAAGAASGSLIKPAAATGGVDGALNNWEIASRLSFFLWSSIPDDELRRAAAVGELTNPAHLRKQAARMLADPKARRMATEFFGQWLGFYQFDKFKGVDTTRFPEFTDEVKSSMYDEAVSFFEYILRKDRPAGELLTADYDFLNAPLAKYYGVSREVNSKNAVELVEGTNAFHRGGMLRLGAVLTATSAPLRTSPVRRGDWVLRRILGTAVPPPPADAGSIPADDKLFGGLSVRERLQVHKRNATCATCHTRIDPLGFPLEHYDSTGRWRDKYSDGKTIDDFGELNDNTRINGIDGLLEYLENRQAEQVQRTLARKLVGYALGRTIQLSDRPLIDTLAAAGSKSRISELVGDIVTSKQFLNRADGDAPPAAPVKRASVEPNQAGRR